MGLGKFSKEQIKHALFRKRSNSAIRQEVKKEGINQKISKRIKFTLADPRKTPIPFKIVFIAIYLIGAGVSMFAGFSENFSILLIAMIISYVAFVFSLITANNVVKQRDTVISRMLELKGSKMKFTNKDRKSIVTHQSEFKILEWSSDLVNPEKMYLYMPTDFDILSVDGFLESFNLVFGGNGQWIADVDDKQYSGFDFNAGVAAIKVSGKLPPMAMWSEMYLDKKDIHWSYFPLALGSENGVPIVNKETGETEHVLGFAVNSGQEKLSKKNGVQIGPEVTSSPQILIAGGTGGGKSLSSKTAVRVIKKESE